MSVRRFEVGLRLDASKNRTPQGFIRADAVIARTGVQVYRRQDGSLQREYRPPETVFHPDALESFSLAPLTLGHPPVPVTAQNVHEYRVGTTGEIVARKDGKYVATKVLITDPRAISSVERGDTVELSCGYECDLDFTPGVTPEGERYDAVQVSVRGNHVALVATGRAGPNVRIKMDGNHAVTGSLKLDVNDAVQVSSDPLPHFQYCGGRVMKKDKVAIKIDGMDFEVKPRVAQAIAKLDKQHAEEIGTLKAQLATAKGESEKLKADAAAEKTRADAAEAKSKTTEAGARERAAQRFDLEEKSRKVLGTEVKLDQMTDDQIRRAVVTKLDNTIKLDGKDEAYVLARYDVAIEDASKKASKKNPAADARFGVGDPNHRDAGEPSPDDKTAAQKERDARDKHRADSREAWKTLGKDTTAKA
jgi:hypothetical protein